MRKTLAAAAGELDRRENLGEAMSPEPAPDVSWLRLECMLCHQSFGINDEHRCPRRAVLFNALPVIAYAIYAAAVIVAACALLWAPRETSLVRIDKRIDGRVH